ncbi:thioredoxin-like protein [Xylariaceae sp. FL0255]|nr:thioredoxin-like protein [Xylariaceae sp. FL0255]
MIQSSWATDETRLRTLIPRCRDLKVVSEPIKLEFWFDFSSPWAYLGWTRLKLLQKTFGLQLKIELRPILLSALFREPQLPSTVISGHKGRQTQLDFSNWVKFGSTVDRQEGCSDEGIGFRWPDVIPIRNEVCWKYNHSVSDKEILKTVLEEAGFDSELLLKEAGSPAAIETLFHNMGVAKEAVMCGVPTVRVFRRESQYTWTQSGDFVWGQDELAVVEDLISGWHEHLEEVAVSGKQRTPGTRL